MLEMIDQNLVDLNWKFVTRVSSRWTCM